MEEDGKVENVESAYKNLINKKIAEFKIIVENIKIPESEKPLLLASVFSADGGYVGTLECLSRKLDKGIIPQLARKEERTCSIGKSVIDGKWYGWSHRAIYGFQIGDTVKEGDCCASSGYTAEYLAKHPEKDESLPVGFTAKTEEDAKKMAIAFADSVS
jgi:hypothetical protein